MGINDCCQTSMHQIDDGVSADGFSKTGQRNPIGKDMDFYTCTICDAQWCRTAQTHEPYEAIWTNVG